MNRQSEKASAFLKELVEVCKKHNLSLGHEDSHGAFLVEYYSEKYCEWLLAAFDETKHGGGRDE